MYESLNTYITNLVQNSFTVLRNVGELDVFFTIRRSLSITI